jgi:hypothetical protein
MGYTYYQCVGLTHQEIGDLTFISISNQTAVMLLCEVAVRPFHELCNADYRADQGCASNGKRFG